MTNAPYNPIDVANYIVWRANELGKPVTHLKLQKLLYYVVAKYLQAHNQHLIDEKIVKWQYGPVVKSVYHQFKILGSLLIKEPTEYIVDKDPNNPFILKWADTEQQIDILKNNHDFYEVTEQVLKDLLPLGAFVLVDITHDEPAWRNFEPHILHGFEPVYSDDELKAASYVRQ